ncbi:MAG: hypothetical protein HZA48_07060 [Planctomycetes bacterium]|nr:hypothetical protein [Planctomycetota bacterium]
MCHTFKYLIAVTALVFTFGLAASSEEAYNIRPLVSKGNKSEVKQSNVAAVKIEMTGMGAMNTKSTNIINFTSEVLEADAKGATKEKITVTEAKMIQAMPQQPEQVMENDLKGKTVTLTNNEEDEVDVECADELSASAEALAKTLMKRESYDKSFPDKPVPVGYKFTVDGKEFGSMLELEEAEGKAEMVFEKVEDHNGKKSAAIAIKVDIKSTMQGVDVTLALSGYAWIALDNRQPNGMSMKGKMNGSTKETEEMPAMKMSGDIEIKQDVTIK